MIIRGRWELPSLYRILGLYAVLVIYGLAYWFFYSGLLTPLIRDDFTAYDPSKSDIYGAITFLTPLALLPMGTTLRSPGQFIAAALTVILFIPIPIVFVAMVGEPEFWSVYILLWLGYLALSTLSALSAKIPFPAVSEHKFNRTLILVGIFLGLGLLYVLATNHFSLVGLNRAHEERANVTVAGFQGYLAVGYATSYGGLMIAMALMYKQYWVVPLAFAGYIICYGSLEERNAALLPFWVTYLYFAHKWFFRDSMAKLLLTVMAPFLVGIGTILAVGEIDRTSFIYDAFTLANYRLYAIPAIAFNAYYAFFSTHPHTYWSHITIIGDFVSNPYGQPLGAVMEDAYHQGSYNASFLETDGLAAAGADVLPFTCAFFGLVMAGINSCMRGLNVTVIVVVMAGSAISLMDTGIGPGLITNGLAVMAVFMLFVPRDASWNLRNLRGLVRRTGILARRAPGVSTK